MNSDADEEVQQFFGRPPKYYSEGGILDRKETTISKQAADLLVDELAAVINHDFCLNQDTSSNNPLLLDVCGGVGYYAALLVERLPEMNYSAASYGVSTANTQSRGKPRGIRPVID